MKYKLLGRSGLKVSELCLGTMGFGTEAGWGADKETSFAIMEAFANAGGNFLESDREGGLGSGLDHRRREFLEGSLAEVVIIAVDLPGALGGHEHARVVGVNVVEQTVDAGGDHVCVAFPG